MRECHFAQVLVVVSGGRRDQISHLRIYVHCLPFTVQRDAQRQRKSALGSNFIPYVFAFVDPFHRCTQFCGKRSMAMMTRITRNQRNLLKHNFRLCYRSPANTRLASTRRDAAHYHSTALSFVARGGGGGGGFSVENGIVFSFSFFCHRRVIKLHHCCKRRVRLSSQFRHIDSNTNTQRQRLQGRATDAVSLVPFRHTFCIVLYPLWAAVLAHQVQDVCVCFYDEA